MDSETVVKMSLFSMVYHLVSDWLPLPLTTLKCIQSSKTYCTATPTQLSSVRLQAMEWVLSWLVLLIKSQFKTFWIILKTRSMRKLFVHFQWVWHSKCMEKKSKLSLWFKRCADLKIQLSGMALCTQLVVHMLEQQTIKQFRNCFILLYQTSTMMSREQLLLILASSSSESLKLYQRVSNIWQSHTIHISGMVLQWQLVLDALELVSMRLSNFLRHLRMIRLIL